MRRKANTLIGNKRLKAAQLEWQPAEAECRQAVVPPRVRLTLNAAFLDN